MTFQVLAKLGPPARCADVHAILQATLTNKSEAEDVREAASAAAVAIYGKK